MEIFKVMGVYIILFKVIRIVVLYISNVVVKLFNIFFICGCFLFICKMVRVIVLFKGGF